MKNLSILCLAILSLGVLACKEKINDREPEVVTVDTTADKAAPYEVAKIDAEFNDPKVEAIFKQYLKLESALVNTDATATSNEAAQLKPLFAEKEVDAAAQTAIAAMADSEDIKLQREHFEAVSAEMEKMLQGALKSGTVYKQFCPMAFNNRGASWISSSRDILNPYFGDKMLKCGRVEAEIR
ncbi:MAG: DUF3347 domain-containing protein [Aequorivita sp.]